MTRDCNSIPNRGASWQSNSWSVYVGRKLNITSREALCTTNGSSVHGCADMQYEARERRLYEGLISYAVLIDQMELSSISQILKESDEEILVPLHLNGSMTYSTYSKSWTPQISRPLSSQIPHIIAAVQRSLKVAAPAFASQYRRYDVH